MSYIQSRPPYPLLHTHVALQVASDTVQRARVRPEGSEYLHAPFREQTVPVRCSEESRLEYEEQVKRAEQITQPVVMISKKGDGKVYLKETYQDDSWDKKEARLCTHH